MTFISLLSSFVGGDVSPPLYVSSEVGNVSNTTLVATFSESLVSPGGDPKAGFTIKINAATETILTGVISTNTITWTFAEIVDSTDTVTIEYNSGSGDIEDTSSNALATFAAQTATNNTAPIAGYLFNNPANSHWIPL